MTSASSEEMFSSYKTILEENISSDKQAVLAMMFSAKKPLKKSKIVKAKSIIEHVVVKWESIAQGKRETLKNALLWLTATEFLGLKVSYILRRAFDCSGYRKLGITKYSKL